MLNAILRWIMPLVALLGLGLAAGALVANLHAVDGSGAVTFLVNARLTSGLLALAGTLVLALLAGTVSAMLIGTRSGLFCAGMVVLAAASQMGKTDDILGAYPSTRTMWLFAAEAGVLAVGGLAIALVVLRMRVKPIGTPRDLSTPEARLIADRLAQREPLAIRDSNALSAFAAAAIACAGVVWVIGQDTLRGQVLAATIIGALVAAVVARMVSQRVSPMLIFAGVLAVGVAGPIVCAFVNTSSLGPAPAALAGKLFALARPVPADYLAGALIGVPMGLTWAGSMIEKHEKK